MVLQAKKVYL